jgi:hypothetical protein
MGWKDARAIEAVAQYARILIGLLVMLVLLVMLWQHDIGLPDVIKALLAVLSLDRIGQIGMVTVQRRK